MNQTEINDIISLIKREVVPAIGCTEPIAVALCVSKATELLGTTPDKIEVLLSANILKNAMGVGIPGTGMTGLPIAIALGAIKGRSEYGLEVLKDCDKEAVEAGKKMIESGCIKIALKEGITEKLYIEATVCKGGKEAKAIIATAHTNFVYLELDGKGLLDKRKPSTSEEEEEHKVELNLKKVYEFATETPVESLKFILESARLNKAAAEYSFNGNYGHGLGKLLRGDLEMGIMGDSLFCHIMSYTSAACDARMGGAMIPVMSNSGSGNQGISATLPVVVFAEEKGCDEESLTRALILSHLTAIYIKQSLGRLSALCGCVVAATGSSCGITLLMGGNCTQVSYAVKNMIANLTGMICDGAKPSCSMKVSSGVSTAVMSAMLAIENRCVSCVEGIIDNDVDLCIRNLTTIGTTGMEKTDKVVLDIMTCK